MDEIERIVQVYKEYLDLYEAMRLLTFHGRDGIHLDDKYFKEVFDDYEVEERDSVDWRYKITTEFGGQTFFALSDKR